MSTPSLVLAFAAIALLPGCASSPSVTQRDPYIKPGLIMLTADQADVRGIHVSSATSSQAPTDLQPLDASAVIAPAGVEVYTLNRAADPADAELMHEEHVVYRRDSAPRWKLDAPAEQKILVGPRVTDGRQDLQPLLNKEVTTLLGEQRRATEANQKAITALLQAVDALNRQQQALLQKQLQSQGTSRVQPSADSVEATNENASASTPHKSS